MPKGNRKNFIGVLLDGSDFDKSIRSYIKDLIYQAASEARREHGIRYTKKHLYEKLEIDRNRLNRLLKALEITNLF